MLNPTNAVLNVSTIGQFTLTGVYADGSNRVLTRDATWRVQSDTAAVLSSGRIVCNHAGSTMVVAAIGGLSTQAAVNCSEGSQAPASPVLAIAPQPLIVTTPNPLHLELLVTTPSVTSSLTGQATWSTNTEVASIDSAGRLTCAKAGYDTVTAEYRGSYVQSQVTCASSAVPSALKGPLLVRLPGSVTPVGYSLTASATASTVDGNEDVSTKATWSASPSGSASVNAGMVKCLESGAITVQASYGGQTGSTILNCAPASYHMATHFVEQSDEFSGPFTSWLNIKLTGAVGDGAADDTQAIQNALTKANLPLSPSRVVYFPAGTYRITGPLTMTQEQYIDIVGEDPAKTRILWDGPSGGTILTFDGSSVMRVRRLTFDGAGIASTAIDLNNNSNGLYTSSMEFSDLRLANVAIGLDLAHSAETTMERIHFVHNTSFGVLLQDWNDINIFIRDSIFSRCGTGISNDPGAGGFNVSNSFFDHSEIADMQIQNTGYFAARGNTSIGSGAFFLAKLIGANNAEITLQGNTVIDPVSTPVVLGNTGPLMMIDNVFREADSATPILTAWDGRAPWDPINIASAAFLFGNIYSTPQAVGSFDGTVVAYDDATVDAASIPTPVVPTEVYTPPFYERNVFEVPKNGDDADIQNAINQAAASHSTKPIVHLPQGGYSINHPITFPVGSDIQVIGDEYFFTRLYWFGPNQGAVFTLPSSSVKLSNFTIDSWEHEYGDHLLPPAGALDGLRYMIDDQPGERIIAEQLEAQGGNVESVNSDGVEHATTNLYDSYMLGSQTGIAVSGGAFARNGLATLGRTDYLSGSIQSEGTGTSLDISNGGRLLVQDNFHDAGLSSPSDFKLSGSGMLTLQGGATYMTSDTTFVMNEFQGDVSLLGLSINGGFSLSAQTSKSNLLALGVAGASGDFQPTGSDLITVGNVLNGYYQSGYHQLSSTSQDVAWMRRMLGQVRSEVAVALGPTPASPIGRIDRVQVLGMSNAVHIVPQGGHDGQYYTLRSSAGILVNRPGQCLASSDQTVPSESGEWILTPGQEGDFLLSPIGHPELAAGVKRDPSGSSQVSVEPLRSDYSQHWNIQPDASGLMQFINRGTGMALQQGEPVSSCAGLTEDLTNAQTHWVVVAH